MSDAGLPLTEQDSEEADMLIGLMGGMERRSPVHRLEEDRERKCEGETKPHAWPAGQVDPTVGQWIVL